MTLSSELRNLMGRLVGTWRTHGQMVDGHQWTGYDIYEWFPGKNVMAHRVDVEMGGTRSESIEMFSPRPDSTDSFDQTGFESTGEVTTAVGSFDDQGRYINDAGTMRARLTFDSPTGMHAQWQRQNDQGAWVDWMSLTFERLTDPHVEVRSKSDHLD